MEEKSSKKETQMYKGVSSSNMQGTKEEEGHWLLEWRR